MVVLLLLASGLVPTSGAFVGVLLSTGSATQAGAVQILILLPILLSQTCAGAITLELIASGKITRTDRASDSRRRLSLRCRRSAADAPA